MSATLYLLTRLSLFEFKLPCFECNELDSQISTKITGNVVLGDRLSCQKTKKFLAPAVGMISIFLNAIYLFVFFISRRRSDLIFVQPCVLDWLKHPPHSPNNDFKVPFGSSTPLVYTIHTQTVFEPEQLLCAIGVHIGEKEPFAELQRNSCSK